MKNLIIILSLICSFNSNAQIDSSDREAFFKTFDTSNFKTLLIDTNSISYTNFYSIVGYYDSITIIKIDTFKPNYIIGFYSDGIMRSFPADLITHNIIKDEWKIIGAWDGDLENFIGIYQFEDKNRDVKTFSESLTHCWRKGQKKSNWSNLDKSGKCCK